MRRLSKLPEMPASTGLALAGKSSARLKGWDAQILELCYAHAATCPCEPKGQRALHLNAGSAIYELCCLFLDRFPQSCGFHIRVESVCEGERVVLASGTQECTQYRLSLPVGHGLRSGRKVTCGKSLV